MTTTPLCASCARRPTVRRRRRARPDRCEARARALVVRGRPSASALLWAASARQVRRLPFAPEIGRGLVALACITAWGSVLLLLGG
jgi:hypothetical protein